MNRLRILFSLIVFVACCPVIATASNGAVGSPSGYEVVRAEFGIFNQPNSGKPAFVPATVVPLTPNQGYGWIMLLRTTKPKIRWREEFTLPAKPNTWGDPEPLGTRSVSTDGRTSVTEREVSPDRGLIFNTWAVAPGDPKGRYVIRVFVEGSLVKVFEFDVQ
ncbi:hypothetical protein [Caldimonas caldifontis]|uniref:hypothetical protein n=1 Tax=Caldimonas caldifontis TaxID=1452508 RepID=UPI0011B0F3E1|nr:hypothetical protein [Caldimonas caldifontis]